MKTFLIVVLIIFVLLFVVYFFNLDMKLVAKIYRFLNKRFDKMDKETKI